MSWGSLALTRGSFRTPASQAHPWKRSRSWGWNIVPHIRKPKMDDAVVGHLSLSCRAAGVCLLRQQQEWIFTSVHTRLISASVPSTAAARVEPRRSRTSGPDFGDGCASGESLRAASEGGSGLRSPSPWRVNRSPGRKVQRNPDLTVRKQISRAIAPFVLNWSGGRIALAFYFAPDELP